MRSSLAKVIVSLTFLMTASQSLAVERVDCLSTQGREREIRMEFTIVDDNADFGFVRYERGSGAILVKHLGSEWDEPPEPDGDPGYRVSTWQEYVDDKPAGQYRIVYQRYLIVSLTYIPAGGGREVRFDMDPETRIEGCRCAWPE